MCQVMCVWAQRAGTVLIFPILEKECMRGRSLMGTCTRLSLALSGSALCLCSFISLSCHHSYICNMSSQHSRAECVYNCAGMCIHLCRRVYIWMRSPYLTCTDAYVCRMRLINVSECLVCSCPDWGVCWRPVAQRWSYQAPRWSLSPLIKPSLISCLWLP